MTRWTRLAVVMVLAAAAILFFTADDDSGGAPRTDDPAPTATPAVAESGSDALDDGVANALGRDALDALGMTATEFCSLAIGTLPPKNVVVFLEPDAAQAHIDDVGAAAASVDSDVGFVNQDDAYEEFTELFGDNELAMANMTADLLPPSFRMTVDPDQLDEVRERFESMVGVRRVLARSQAISDDVVAACEE